LFGLTQFIGLALYLPFTNWKEEIRDVNTLHKIFIISLAATATFLCLGYGLQYLPITSSIIIRVRALSMQREATHTLFRVRFRTLYSVRLRTLL
jgi:hypothetical protein